MNNKFKSTAAAGLGLGFIGLSAGFLFNLWGRPLPPASLRPVEPQFTNVATVRLSAAQLIAGKGDISGLDCYACHEKGKIPVLTYNENKKIVLPKEHDDLVMEHGRNNRNNDCYNCHDAEHLDMLKTRDGQVIKLTESTRLCGSCHGPTYRDWEAGIHGRTSGFWNRSMGPIERADCVSCHYPHSPAFPSVKPAPGPNPLHAKTSESH